MPDCGGFDCRHGSFVGGGGWLTLRRLRCSIWDGILGAHSILWMGDQPDGTDGDIFAGILGTTQEGGHH